MEELQTEIQAIQETLRSIRADAPRTSTPTLSPMLNPALLEEPKRDRQSHPKSNPQSPARSAPKSQVSKPVSDDLAIAAERLSRLSSTYLQKLEAATPKPPSVHSINEAFQRLEAQAEQVNQLSVAQETAIMKLKVIADQVERDWKASDEELINRSGRNAIQLPPLCEYLETAIPHVERDQNGGLILTSRSVDLFKAEREAEMNAEVLRHRAKKRESSVGRLWQWLADKPKPELEESQAHAYSQDYPQTYSQDYPQAYSQVGSPAFVPANPRPGRRVKRSTLTMGQAVVLVVGAVVTRVVLDAILLSFPGLWFPAIAIMSLPGAIAVYRSTMTPDAGVIWGYRLVLILIGLLIGGRL
jgi:hypothetical protein